jgi:hypothetical protein
MPTTIRYSAHRAAALSDMSNVTRDRHAKIGNCALLIAWAVIMLIVSAVAPSSPEAITMDPLQLLATF